MKYPLDTTPYAQDSRSQPIALGIADGGYVYVQDEHGVIFVVPDGSHLHPKVLGGARPAMYAGDLTIDSGEVKDVTNLSGTFEFDDPDGLLAIAATLRSVGYNVRQGAVRLFPSDGSRPIVIE
jgi:hypothetical protein